MLVAVVGGCADEKKATTESFGSETTQKLENEPDGAAEPNEDPPTTTTTQASEEPTVVDAGFSTYPALDETWATAGAVIANPSSESFAFVEVVFTLKAAGKPIATETSYVDLLPANGEAYANVDIIQNLTATPDEIEVTVVTNEDGIFSDPEDYPALPLTVTGVSADDFGAKVTGTIKNPTDEVLSSTTISCVMTSAGKIVGGIAGYADTLAPGGEIAWEATNTFEGVAFDAAKCSAAGDLSM